MYGCIKAKKIYSIGMYKYRYLHILYFEELRLHHIYFLKIVLVVGIGLMNVSNLNGKN